MGAFEADELRATTGRHLRFLWAYVGVFSVIIGLFALHTLAIGLRVVGARQPSIVPSRRMYAMLVLVFIPVVGFQVYQLVRGPSVAMRYLPLLNVVMPLVLLAFFWKAMSGYSIFGPVPVHATARSRRCPTMVG